MPTVSLYLPEDLMRRLRDLAEQDGRSLSNWVTLQLRAVVGRQAGAVCEFVEPDRPSRQVDLVDAIAGKILSGPTRSRRAPGPAARGRAHK